MKHNHSHRHMNGNAHSHSHAEGREGMNHSHKERSGMSYLTAAGIAALMMAVLLYGALYALASLAN